MLAAPAAAAPFTGGFSPTVFDGRADLNGDNEVNGRDDSNAFYGDTSIIDGALDCDAWGADPNNGSPGDGTITGADNCTLVGYDGTADGVTIEVVAGEFDVSDGPLPRVFNAADPDNRDVSDSDFAWSAINGRVDSNGSETINANDCHLGLIGKTVDAGLGDPHDGADVLGSTQAGTNPCEGLSGFSAADNGLVDLNSDRDITAADSCTNGCFFRHNVASGVVQAAGAVAAAGGFTGGFSPSIVSGLADLNGNGTVTGRDDSNAFYGDTHIIDGSLDCNAWATDNDGAAGDGTIDANDNCTLIGYDGTADGVTIDVVNGEFQVANGPLPTVFPDPATPNNRDIGDSRFAWSAINGRVDSNGNEFIDPGDCHLGLIGKTSDPGLGDPLDGADVLGSTQAGTNPCEGLPGFSAADNGRVDLNSDRDITTADSCTNGCFFGHNVRRGLVQGAECRGFEGDPRNDVSGTAASETLIGTSGNDIICGYGGNDTLIGRGGNDLLLGGAGADILRGGPGADELRGGRGPDLLFGGRGNDRLFGGRGNDYLDGGRGRDTCFGGPGRDTMVRCEVH